MDIDRLGYPSETRLVDLDLIYTVGQTLQNQGPLIIAAEDTLVLIRLADDLNRGSYRETRRIGHLYAKLSCVALGKKKYGTRE